jgi:hypothetical protein
VRRCTLYGEEQHYEVTLWQAWPSSFPEHVDTLWAADHLDAIEQVMRIHGLSTVRRAAVTRCGVYAASRYIGVRLTDNGLRFLSYAKV